MTLLYPRDRRPLEDLASTVTPTISVLVPAFQDARFLDVCLRSIAAQTRADFEVIVADDASTDETPRIAAEWAFRDARIRLSRIESNIGMTPNWNRALSEARGALVLKLDADDAMTPRCLEVLSEELLADSGVLFSACRTLDCDEELRVLGPYRGDEAFRLHGLDPELRHALPGLEWLRMSFDDIQLWPSTAQMYRRQELVKLGGWDERWIASDTDLILRALALDRLVVHRPEIGTLYRRRAGSSAAREKLTGANRLEAAMIALAALERNCAALRPWSRPLRRNWWRLWKNFQSERARLAVATDVPPGRKAKLEARVDEVEHMAPPVGVRVEGELRAKLWRFRSRTRREPTSERVR